METLQNLRTGQFPSLYLLSPNQANAQHSTGPTSAGGKAAICLNAFRHGLAGAFMMLADESREDFDGLHQGLVAEHLPETPTEILLVESMAQHYWLMQRAIRLQTLSFDLEPAEADKNLALFLRYQTTHERAFYKALNTFVKLRADKRKAVLDEAALCQRAEDSKKIGFVSQEAKLSRARQQAELAQNRERERAEEYARKQAVEKRKQKLHKWKGFASASRSRPPHSAERESPDPRTSHHSRPATHHRRKPRSSVR